MVGMGKEWGNIIPKFSMDSYTIQNCISTLKWHQTKPEANWGMVHLKNRTQNTADINYSGFAKLRDKSSYPELGIRWLRLKWQVMYSA